MVLLVIYCDMFMRVRNVRVVSHVLVNKQTHVSHLAVLILLIQYGPLTHTIRLIYVSNNVICMLSNWCKLCHYFG